MKLSLATKTFLGFSLMLAVFGAVPIFGIAQLNAVRQRLNLLNRGYLPINRVIADIETLQESARRSLDGILKFDNIDLQRPLLLNIRRSFSRNMTSRIQRGQSVLRRLEREIYSEQDQRFLEDLDKHLERIRSRSTNFEDALRAIDQSLKQAPLPATELAEATEIQKIGRGLARDVRVFKLATKNVITAQMLLIERDQSSAIGVIIWLTILALAVGILITFLALLALRPIRQLAAAARSISEGNFSAVVDIASNDEFGLLAGEFNRMARSLAQREEELVRQGEQVKSVNRELRQSSIDLALLKLYNEHIIRSMPSAIVVADASGEVTTINPAAERLWLLESTTTIGSRMSDLPFGQALKDLTDTWDRALKGKERLVLEAVEFQVADRGQILVDLHFSPLLGTDGETHGVLLVGEDVTERVRTKQALLQSERLATIGRMSAMVAHEIRNPLSSIGLNTELLQEEIEDPTEDSAAEAHAILNAISREVERLVEVTDEYLRFARLPKPNLSPENLNNLIEDLLTFMQGEMQDAGVKLRYEPGDRVGQIPADEGQLRQAFLNLLKNSAESMPQGGVLTVRTEQDGQTTRIRISDTGKGIDETSLGRIFDPFFSTRDGGTGLGLSLTQQIVNDHGGHITCDSSPGEGTSFLVELPAYNKEAVDG